MTPELSLRGGAADVAISGRHCRPVQAVEETYTPIASVAALSERHAGWQHAPHGFCGMRPPSLSLRGRSAPVAIRTPSSSASFRQGGLSDASHPSSYRISQCACWKNIFYQLSFIPNRIDCSFSFQRLSVWMTSSSVSVFGRICKMENWKNLYRSGCAQITSFISLLCPCSEST